MPLMNKNYVTPAWIDNAAPPINDDELNDMSQTLEGSQILVGNGAPTSATTGKVGQRYADISTTPATIYELKGAGFPNQPIPKLQTSEEITAGGYLVGYNQGRNYTWKVGSDNNHEVFVAVYEYSNYSISLCFASRSPGANAYLISLDGGTVSTINIGSSLDSTYNLYHAHVGLTWGVRPPPTETIIEAPSYTGEDAALQAIANPPPQWEQEADPNRNLARPYSTGSSYAAGDYCIHDGKLWRALEATGGAWDGSKWEQAKYADGISGHEADQNNPHNVTAAQTGAISASVLATVQATTTAVRDYYAGEYFFYDGQLYEVKEAVEQGGDLFAIGSPPGVSSYDVNVWYPASAYDSNVPQTANVLASGFMLQQYRMIYEQRVPTGKARYFYWWTQNQPSIPVESPHVTYNALYCVVYSPDKDDINQLGSMYGIETTLPPTTYRTADGSGLASSIKTGDIYFICYPIAAYDDYYNPPFAPTWPDDMQMFYGNTIELKQMLANDIGRKSEPAELSDDVASLHPKTGVMTLSATWTGSDPYSQTVTLSGATVTGKSKVDLTPTAAQLDALAADGVISLMIENNGGTLTAWAVGGTPSAAMTISCTVTETV